MLTRWSGRPNDPCWTAPPSVSASQVDGSLLHVRVGHDLSRCSKAFHSFRIATEHPANHDVKAGRKAFVPFGTLDRDAWSRLPDIALIIVAARSVLTCPCFVAAVVWPDEASLLVIDH